MKPKKWQKYLQNEGKKKKKNLQNLKNCQNNLWGDIFCFKAKG